MTKQLHNQLATPAPEATLQSQPDLAHSSEPQLQASPVPWRQPAQGLLASLPPRPPSAANTAIATCSG
jgi:hypothetical protein